MRINLKPLVIAILVSCGIVGFIDLMTYFGPWWADLIVVILCSLLMYVILNDR